MSSVSQLATEVGGSISANQAIKQQQKFNSTESQKAREWNLNADNTRYQRTVADMQAAGVNPALAMDGGVSTQATSNATAQSESGVNAMISLINAQSDLKFKQKQLQVEKELKEKELAIAQQNANTNANVGGASARKQNTEADILEIDREYRRIEKELSIKASELQNQVTEKSLHEIDVRIENIEANTALLVKQAATEEQKAQYLVSQSHLADAHARQILALLPFQMLLTEAQADNQRSAASLAFVEAAMKQGLLDQGYIEGMIKAQNADISVKEVQAALDQFNLSGKEGTRWNEEGGFWRSTPSKVMNFLMQTSATIGAIVGNLTSGIKLLGN
nr:MAG TPA: minor capsid protein [Microviridae sp.]